MKKLIGGIVVGLFVACAIASGYADEGEKPLRVLVTYGGHDFQEKEFFAMWDSFPGITYRKAKLPEEGDLLAPGLEEEFDVIVSYDMSSGLSEEQRARYLALLERGIGLVALHHNLGAHRDWPEYTRVRGGKWVFEEETLDGRAYQPSTYDHDQKIPIIPTGGDHVITKGMDDFVLQDETYGGIYVQPEVRVILLAVHSKASRQFAWTNQYGKSRVVTFLAGHDAKAWGHPGFQEILIRSIRWTARSD